MPPQGGSNWPNSRLQPPRPTRKNSIPMNPTNLYPSIHPSIHPSIGQESNWKQPAAAKEFMTACVDSLKKQTVANAKTGTDCHQPAEKPGSRITACPKKGWPSDIPNLSDCGAGIGWIAAESGSDGGTNENRTPSDNHRCMLEQSDRATSHRANQSTNCFRHQATACSISQISE